MECKSARARQLLALPGENVKESSQLMGSRKGEGLFDSWETRGGNSLLLLQDTQPGPVCFCLCYSSTRLGIAKLMYVMQCKGITAL